ncbi:MAG TPA: hypothetical protein VK213_04825 [Bacteroidales bacterium]|nr:hypothetical protein [Bacteroidales bacterium]
MDYNPGILFGQITKTSGFEGAVVIRLEKKFIDNIPQMESVFLEIDGRPVPFFISELEETGPEIKVIFDDYSSVDKVTEFKGCRVFLTKAGESDNDDPGLSSIIGFEVLDQAGNNLGRIREVITGPQLLLSIEDAAHNEILIPLHEDLIIGISKAKKSVRMEVPEGLTDINL